MVSGIFGGSVADPTRYPYYTRVNVTYFLSGEKVFAGTLIAPDVVLTSAPPPHFSDSIDDVIVELMAWVNRTSIVETGYEHERKVRFWLPHPKFNEDALDNDIALVFLDEPVMGVPMPKLNRDKAIPLTDQTLTELGMGVIEDRPGKILIYPDTLMEVDLDVTSFEACEKASTPPPIVEAHVFCAGGDRKGSCWDDFGNPLLDLSEAGNAHPDKDILVGVSSYVTIRASYDDPEPELECAAAGYPSGFTRVAFYSDWIESNVRKYSRGQRRKNTSQRHCNDNHHEGRDRNFTPESQKCEHHIQNTMPPTMNMCSSMTSNCCIIGSIPIGRQGN
jgi:secreted trypsin-like serine protease